MLPQIARRRERSAMQVINTKEERQAEKNTPGKLWKMLEVKGVFSVTSAVNFLNKVTKFKGSRNISELRVSKEQKLVKQSNWFRKNNTKYKPELKMTKQSPLTWINTKHSMECDKIAEILAKHSSQ